MIWLRSDELMFKGNPFMVFRNGTKSIFSLKSNSDFLSLRQFAHILNLFYLNLQFQFAYEGVIYWLLLFHSNFHVWNYNLWYFYFLLELKKQLWKIKPQYRIFQYCFCRLNSYLISVSTVYYILYEIICIFQLFFVHK